MLFIHSPLHIISAIVIEIIKLLVHYEKTLIILALDFICFTNLLSSINSKFPYVLEPDSEHFNELSFCKGLTLKALVPTDLLLLSRPFK